MTPLTLLLRQIHPSFIQSDRVTSQAFRPTPKDENRLSTYDGDLITALESWRHFITSPGCRSSGVMAVSKGQIDELALETIQDGAPFPEHVSIDFSRHGKSEVEKKSKILARHAHLRGWLYQAQ